MPTINIMDIPERQMFGYIDSPFLPNVERMLRHILFYDYEKYECTKPKGWTSEIIKDILNEAQFKSDYMVALSVDPDMGLRGAELDPLHNYKYVTLFNRLSEKEPWSKLGTFCREKIDMFCPNCQSVILVKNDNNLVLVTRFSLRRFLRYTQRIPVQDYLDRNPDPFMASLTKREDNTAKEYDYRFKATASWNNDLTLHYYGVDHHTSDILHYDSTEHTDVIYVQCAHQAAIRNGVFCAYYREPKGDAE